MSQLAHSIVMGLVVQCAPSVAPETLMAVIETESKRVPFAINVNGLSQQPRRPRSAAEGARVARYWHNRGYSVDMGLGQINSNNLSRLNLTFESVWEPCTNVSAAGMVLLNNYRSLRPSRDPQAALHGALSMYNTGSASRGFRNGYVRRVLNNAGVSTGVTPVAVNFAGSPEYAPSAPAQNPYMAERTAIVAENAGQGSAMRPRVVPPPPPAWDVFAVQRWQQEHGG